MNNLSAGRNHLSVEDCVRAITLVEEGRTQSYVAQLLRVDQSTISRVIKRFQENGQYHRRAGSGRNRCTTLAEDRYIKLICLRKRFVTGRSIKSDLIGSRDTPISERTVRRRIKESNLTARKPALCPELSTAHRRARLTFALEHENWTMEQWANVLFSDESRFCLGSSDRRIRVYRRPGERFAPACIISKRAFGGGSIMVWGGISLTARTELVPISTGTMTAIRYIDECLEPHVMPFAPFIGDEFMFMHDNARPHVANVVKEYLEAVDVLVMRWPACSPDLNPIEHMWDIIGRRIYEVNVSFSSPQELINAVIQAWEQIPQDTVANLINSMPERVKCVINARGGSTRY